MWRRLVSTPGASSSHLPVKRIVPACFKTFCTTARNPIGRVTRKDDPEPLPDFKNIDFPIRCNLVRMGITSLTAIQKECLPAVLSGSDVFGRGPPASGKTLAFCIPLLQRVQVEWKNESPHETIAMVLAPTRELAQQISMVLHQLRNKETTVVLVSCLGNGPTRKELSLHSTLLRQGGRIVVGTAGVVNKLCESKILDLKNIKMLVLDEVDEMSSRGLEKDLDSVISYFPPKKWCQFAVFAAAVDPWLQEKVLDRLQTPRLVDVVGKDGVPVAPAGVTHTWCKIARNENRKVATLIHLIDTNLDPENLARLEESASQSGSSKSRKGKKDKADDGQAIVFCGSRHEATLLSSHPSLEGRAAPFHADLLPWQRVRALKLFREGYTQVLVATDLAARGLDIPNVRSRICHSVRRSTPVRNINLDNIKNRWEQYDPSKPEYKWFPTVSGASRRGFMLGNAVFISFGAMLIFYSLQNRQGKNEPRMERMAGQSFSSVTLDWQDNMATSLTDTARKYQRKSMGITARPPGSAEIREFDYD